MTARGSSTHGVPEWIRIPARYCGPPASANGGVTAGRVAGYLAAPVPEVTLRRPPPLDTDLQVEVGADRVLLRHGDALVAEAAPGQVSVTPPAPVGLQAARAAAADFEGTTAHPFPRCFVCGLDSERPDGLRVHPGPVGDSHVAGVWTPTDEDPAMVWAALDCPGGFASGQSRRAVVLGRMALRLDAVPTPGRPYVVQGWMFREDGRKRFAGTCLYDEAGRLLALAQQTWVIVEPRRVGALH